MRELSLRAPLVFRRRIALASASPFFPSPFPSEGEDFLYAFPDDLFPDSDEGPRCRRPLAPPLAAWASSTAAASEAGADDPGELRAPGGNEARVGGAGAADARASGAEPTKVPDDWNDGFVLSAGLWIFEQVRIFDAEGLADAFEAFARDAWWERRDLEGPWFLRLVGEDGKMAWQFLRREAATPG